MALIGNMIALAFKGNPAIINYDMFVSVFGMLSLFYLFPASFTDSLTFHPMIPLILDVLNAIFWFCGAVATAAYLGAHSCSNMNYTENNFITNGAYDMGKRCREAQASTAFLFFGWACFTASAVVSGLGMGGSSPSFRGGRGGVRRGGPSMSQV